METRLEELLNTSEDAVIQTNCVDKIVTFITGTLPGNLVLKQSNLPLSPILSLVASDSFNVEIFRKTSKGVSKSISEYFLKFLEGEDVGIEAFFEEYFDRTEFLVRRNEFFSLISEYFLEVVKRRNVENLVILVNNSKLFASTWILLDFMLRLKSKPRVIVVQDVSGSSEFNNELSFLPAKFCSFMFLGEDNVAEAKLRRNPISSKRDLKMFYEYYRCMCWEVCEVIALELLKTNPELLRKQKFVQSLVFSLLGVNKVEEGIDYLLEFIEEIKGEKDLVLLSRMNRLLSYMYALSQSRWKLAGITARKSYEIAVRAESKREILLSRALMFLLGILNREEASRFFAELDANKSSFGRLYRYITTFYYFYLSMKEVLGIENILILANESAKVFRKERDNFHLMLYYHLLANIFVALGEKDKAIESDLKALKIGKAISTPNISHIYNSLSHVFYTTDNFKKALYFSEKSLKESIKELDVKEICMTLVNIAYIYLITNNYSQANDVLDVLMEVKRKAGIQTLPIHSNVKLWVMDIYVKRQIGRPSKFSKDLFLFPKDELGGIDDEGKGFYYWGLSMLSDCVDEKIDLLKTSLDYLVRNEFKYIEVKVLRDLLNCLNLKGRLKESREIRERFLKSRNDHPLYPVILDTDKEVVKLRRINIPKELMIQQASYQNQMIYLQNRKNDLRFLNKLQKILLSENSEEEVIDKVINIIKNTFLVERVAFFDKEKSEIFSVPALTEEEKRNLVDLMKDKAAEGCVSTGLLPRFTYVHPISFTSGEVKGYLMLESSNKEYLVEDELPVIRVSALLISSKLEIIRNSARLEKLAKIDFLTGVLSRPEVDNILMREVERCRRVPGYCFSLALIDLDNFKYYNDTFGHMVGDAILREFGRLLSQSVRKVDFVGRFGGDEFVVIMPYTTREKGLIAAKRWMKIFETQFYRDVILAHGKGEVSIPNDKELGMSIGVSDIVEANYDIENLFRMADERLYISKRSSQRVN